MANDNDFVKDRLDTVDDERFQPNASHARVRMRTREARQPKRWVLSVAATAAVVAIMLLALPSARAVALEGGRSLTSVHEALLEFHNYIYAEFRLLTGQPPLRQKAPELVLTDSSGNVVRLSDYRDKVVLLNTWATWCAPCKAEVPWFVDLQKQYAGDLVILGVSFDEDGWRSVRPFLDARHVNYPVMLATPEMPDLYQVKQLPTTFLIDRKGRIAGTHETLASKKLYEDWIRSVL